jgi:uncharacterized DUF497 family protein
MGLLFEWDPKKARLNFKIHGITFDEASTAFRDPLSDTIKDPLHSEDEERFVLIGRSIAGHSWLSSIRKEEIEFVLSAPG